MTRAATRPWPALLAMLCAALAGAGALAGNAPRPYKVHAHSSEDEIRAAILKRIPLGVTKNDVRQFIDQRLRHTGPVFDLPISPSSYLTESDRQKLREMGLPVKEPPAVRPTSRVSVQVGDYYILHRLTYVRVYVEWYFDADDRVLEVEASKNEDTPS